MANGSDIIIKGGSCEIHFDHESFKKDETQPGKRSHDTLKIKRIVITGDQSFDSGEIPSGFRGEIRISVA